MSKFRNIERKQSKLSCAIMGVSGSGKSGLALLIATNLASSPDKVYAADTENGSLDLFEGITMSDGKVMSGVKVTDLANDYGSNAPTNYIAARNDAVAEGCEVFISDVNYIDYYHDYTFDKTDGIANCLARYFCKRKYFLQERELRLVYYDFKATIDGDNVGQKFDVSINTLLDEVWIAPNAKGWYENLIKDEMQLHGINKPVKRSCI